MENKIQLSDKELEEIKQLQVKYQEMIFKFGELQIEKMELDGLISSFVENEKKLKENWSNLKNTETLLLDNILKKYGEGNLDLKNGIFISSKS